jgi:hypothetical protein
MWSLLLIVDVLKRKVMTLTTTSQLSKQHGSRNQVPDNGKVGLVDASQVYATTYTPKLGQMHCQISNCQKLKEPVLKSFACR